MKPIVLQSHNRQQITPWMERCLASVTEWAAMHGMAYRFHDDDLFDFVPDEVLEKVGDQTVIATDLARLRLMQHYLKRGHPRVFWLDADMLVFEPKRFDPCAGDHAVGREVWVQKTDKGRLKAYRKVHNAFLMTSACDSFLPFYAEAAERMLRRAEPPLVPQFIGPKLMTALHNISGLAVEERAGMLSPLALRDLLRGDGKAQEMTVEGHGLPPAAYNLSASYCGRESDGVLNTPEDYSRVVALLLGE